MRLECLQPVGCLLRPAGDDLEGCTAVLDALDETAGSERNLAAQTAPARAGPNSTRLKATTLSAQARSMTPADVTNGNPIPN